MGKKTSPCPCMEGKMINENNTSSKLCTQEEIKCGHFGNIGLFGFSSVGQNHKKNGTPGQDANYIKVVNNNHNVVIASIADGVGSCVLSHYGSSIATKTATDYLANIFHYIDIKKIDDKSIGELIRGAMRKALEEVEKEANLHQQLPYSYQSTLTTAIYDGDSLYFGHIGDDGIIALTKNGLLQMVTQRHKGDEASSLFPLQSGEKHWQVSKVSEPVDGIIMVTDGVLDAFVTNEVIGNLVYYPFFESAFKNNYSQNGSYALGQHYLNRMNQSDFRQLVTDDLTFVSIVNPERIKSNPYKFDSVGYNKTIQRHRAQVKQALYGKSSQDSRSFDDYK